MAEDRKKTLELKIQNLKQRLGDLTKQIGVKNAQINAFGKEASIPSAASTSEKFADREKQKFKNEKNNARDKIRIQLQDIKLQIANTKDEIKSVELELANPDKENKEETTEPSTVEENIKKEKMAKLTKKDILKMVESAEPTRMTKSELIESVISRLDISNSLLTEDIDDDLKRQIESGEHDYSKYLDPETVKRMSKEILDDIKANLEARGVRVSNNMRQNLQNAQGLMASGLFGALQKEASHKRELEQLAVKLVSEEWNIPEGSVNFEVEITGHPDLGGRLITKERLKMKKGNKRPPEGKTKEQLDKKITKRRLQNSIIQGSARKAQNLFHMASDELNQIDPSLVNDYSKIMAANDYTYWAVDKDTLARESEHGLHAGQFRISYATTPPTVHAEGMTFAFLLHELGKAIPELIANWGREKDKATRDFVEDKTDNLEMEPDDIRLGVKIWEKILEVMDVDAIPYKSQVLQKIFMIGSEEDSDDEFNNLIRGLMNNSQQAIETVKDIVYETIRENNEDEVEQVMKKFRDDEPNGGDIETPEGPEGPDDEDDELARLLGKKGGEEVDDPRTWSIRELEAARDEALDQGIKTGDYSMVAFYQSIIDEKS